MLFTEGWQKDGKKSDFQQTTQKPKLGGGENNPKEENWLLILVIRVLKADSYFCMSTSCKAGTIVIAGVSYLKNLGYGFTDGLRK